MSKKLARPKQDIIDDVLMGMRIDGLSLRKACLAADTNTPSFLRWVDEDPALAEQYAHAREAMLDKLADETIEISDAPVGTTDNGATDSGAVAKQRLQVDTRKWILSKLAPKKYGDKLENVHTGPDGGPVKVERIERVIVDPA